MIQLYRPGSSVLHRAPAALKLGLLALLAPAASLLPREPGIAFAALCAVCGLFLVARLPVAVLAGEVWRLRAVIAVLAAALWLFIGPAAAVVGVARVATVVLLAALLTLTTRMGDLLGVLRRLLRPAARVGIDAETVALVVSLTIAAVPVIAALSDEVRDAQRARGVRLRVAWIVPLMVRTLRHADAVGDALVARGLVDPVADVTGAAREVRSGSSGDRNPGPARARAHRGVRRR
ncbi:CbiQ family ECF transporter T component [Microbacterium sp. XT11]|uniref:CbiQ family ECF transporter T component n=1 Tax=Microbacterium sp. XT11 TaxID=367477 RepID=UPI0009FB5893|nr:CbiQ family ECF transporter T component [Microbacterium sp. XT11]